MPIDNTVQLTRIVAPNLSEIDYGSKLQEVFDNINENFKKVASMPFVQGVQGDSYTLVVKHVFEKSLQDNKFYITAEGVELLNSIFHDVLVSKNTSITEDMDLDKCKNALNSLNLNKVNVLDIFNSVETDTVCNNLYFYAIIDDLGVEQNKYLGQLYYFVDARVSAVANARADENQIADLAKFSDFSGFYMYDPSENAESRYFKTDILPTIYYDSTRDDICWKLNGKNTGISAVGAKGEDGTDAALQFVKCEVVREAPDSQDVYTSSVSAVFDSDVPGYWDSERKTLEDGLALICIVYTGGSEDPTYSHAFGSIIVDKSSPIKQGTAYWAPDTIVQGMATETAIINFFDRVGLNSGASIKALRIPASAGTGPQTFHTLGINNPNNETDIKDVLIQRQYLENNELKRDIGDPNPDSNIIVDNYNIKLERQDEKSNKPSVILSDTDIELKNGTSTKIKLSNDDGNVLEVRGGVSMNPSIAHFSTDVRFAGQTAFTITSGQENDLKPLIINASQVTIGNGNSPRLEVLGDIQTPVTRQTISYIDNDIFFKPNTWGNDTEYDKSKFVHNIVAKGSGDDVDNDAQYGGTGSHIMLAAEKITLYKEPSQRYKTNVIARADVYMASNETREYDQDQNPGDVPDSVACLASAGTIRNVAYTQFIGPSWTDMTNLWTEARKIIGKSGNTTGTYSQDTGRAIIDIAYINISWEYLASNDYSYIVYSPNKGPKMGCIYNLDEVENISWGKITDDRENFLILGITGRMGIYLNSIYFKTIDIIPRIAIINPTNNAIFRFFIDVHNIRISNNQTSESQKLRIGTWVTYTNSGKIFYNIGPNPFVSKFRIDAASAEFLVATDSGAQGHCITQNSVVDM